MSIPTIRVGIPSPGGGLLAAARAEGYPVMISANSFLRRGGMINISATEALRMQKTRPYYWRSFGRCDNRTGTYRIPSLDWKEISSCRQAAPDLEGMDAMLDSAGFVAMVEYGETLDPDFYVSQIVARHRWTHWAQIDLCCEPKVAPDPVEVLFRQAETVRLYHECLRAARRHGVPNDPMPVLQGWTARDYARGMSLFQADISAPDLVGVGSVCQRHIHGPSGIVAVVETLDQVLPANTKLHLFGVKDEALSVLLRYPRLARRLSSIDSMAWDMRARLRWRTGRSIERRASVMREWYDEQIRWAAAAAAKQLPERAAKPTQSLDWRTGDASLDGWIEMVASGEIDMNSAYEHYWHEARHNTVPAGVRSMLHEAGRPDRNGILQDTPAHAHQLGFDLAA